MTDGFARFHNSVFERYKRYVNGADDIRLIILNGHLLIEEVLIGIVDAGLPHREHLDNARLSFAQRVLLSRALGKRHHNHVMWTVIERVNSLRNDLAHNLESPKMELKIRRLLEIQESSIGDMGPLAQADLQRIKKLSVAGQLKEAIQYCLGFLGPYHGQISGVESHDFFADMAERWKSVETTE